MKESSYYLAVTDNPYSSYQAIKNAGEKTILPKF